MYSYRNFILKGWIDQRSFKSMVVNIPDVIEYTLHGKGFKEISEEGFATTTARLNSLQEFGLVVKYGRDTGNFFHGEGYLSSLIFSFIPRVIWPSKPDLTKGKLWVTQEIWGKYNTNASIAITILGDMYLNFGVIGIIIGMFGLGSLMALIYHSCIRKGRSYAKLLFYTMLIGYTFHWHASYLIPSIILFVRIFIVAKMLEFIFFKFNLYTRVDNERYNREYLN